METPKKPLKKTSATTKAGAKKATDKPEATKPKRFVDDDEDDEFDAPLDDLAAYESFDGLEEEDDF